MNAKLFLPFLFFFIISISIVSAQEIHASDDPICIAYFQRPGCSHCAKVSPFLDDMQDKYGAKINVHKYDITESMENYELYTKFCTINKVPAEKRGVPFLVIADNYYLGDTPIIENLEANIDDMIESGERICLLGEETGCHEVNETSEPGSTNLALPWVEKLSIPFVISAALIDSINPCAMGVMIFLIVILLTVHGSNRRQMIKIGSIYIAAVFATYFIAGVALLSFTQTEMFGQVRSIVFMVLAVLMLIAALINIKDFFFYGKGFSLKIPESSKGIIKKLVYKASIPAAIVLGFLVSVFELPCTGEVYLASLSILSEVVTMSTAVLYLLLYNFIFVLPLIIILVLAVLGIGTDAMQHLIDSQKHLLRLVMGIILMLMAVLLWMFAQNVI
ncbi:MAG: hypothetical protein GY861_06305 [bacterium]|nr:hypothetical protein [bacterium]